jgi:hypothetical protein
MAEAYSFQTKVKTHINYWVKCHLLIIKLKLYLIKIINKNKNLILRTITNITIKIYNLVKTLAFWIKLKSIMVQKNTINAISY